MRAANHLAAYMQHGTEPPAELADTIKAWAQMEARRLGAAILRLPKDHRRAAIDEHAQPFRDVVEQEILWLFNQRKAQHENRSNTSAVTQGGKPQDLYQS